MEWRCFLEICFSLLLTPSLRGMRKSGMEVEGKKGKKIEGVGERKGRRLL